MGMFGSILSKLGFGDDKKDAAAQAAPAPSAPPPLLPALRLKLRLCRSLPLRPQPSPKWMWSPS